MLFGFYHERYTSFMIKAYFNTIRAAPHSPFLGVFAGTELVSDIRALPAKAEIVDFNKKAKHVSDLAKFKHVKCVNVDFLSDELVEALQALPKLESIFLSHKGDYFPSLSQLKRCKYICLNSLRNLTNLDFLADMPALESVFIYSCTKLETIEALASLVALKELDIHSNSSSIRDFEPLFEARTLEYLNLFTRKMNFKARWFARLGQLQEVVISPLSLPFEFYAELDGVLADSVKRNYVPFYTYETPCEKAGHTALVEAVGSRQRQFCTECKPKKWQELKDRYESLSGLTLTI